MAESSMQPTRLLADIGGTNARFALLVNETVQASAILTVADYPHFEQAVAAYLDQHIAGFARPSEAAFAIAAPIVGDAVSMTNHSWRFSVAELRARLQLERLIVLNDFTALAMSIRYLPPTELQSIGGGVALRNAPLALLGPGTGLGVSGLIPHGAHWIPLQGEGGHVTLGASDAREAAVLEALRPRYEHISAERLLSGPGLLLLYEALCKLDDVTPVTLQPADITERGLSGIDAQCQATLDLFCAMLGTVAGNLALTLGALGGVYIGGGIVPRLGAFFAASRFRQRFEAKGRYANYLAAVPVYVIHSALPAFVGLSHAFTDPGPRIESRV